MNNLLEYVVKKKLTSVECCQCGHLILMTEDFEERRRRDHRSWFCLNCGTNQSWRGESDIEAAKRELKAAQQREETIRADLAATRKRLSAQFGENTKLRNRVKNGVCPCCTRSFTNLRRHMATKHPEFQAEAKVEQPTP